MCMPGSLFQKAVHTTAVDAHAQRAVRVLRVWRAGDQLRDAREYGGLHPPNRARRRPYRTQLAARGPVATATDAG